MGVIAAARHVELDEPVALKFLRPDLLRFEGAAELSARFLREAKATIKIRSPHVPRILDVATTPDGVPFMVMELLSGEDLDAFMERTGPLPVELAVEIMLQALEGLAAAHALGMVHRDFKPANVFLGRGVDGSLAVKVLDFGIAKLQDSGLLPTADASMTSTNHVMGSPRYMAPEQMRSARDIDARADVWAVGTTLYEMLVCAPPFEGESIPQICMSILQDRPKPIGEKRPEVPPGLVAAIERCLGKTPDTRTSNVAELADAIAPYGPQPGSLESAARTRKLASAMAARGSRPSLADGGVRPAGVPDVSPAESRPAIAPIVPIVPVVRGIAPSAIGAPAVASIGETSGSWARGGAGLPPKRSGSRLVALVGVAVLSIAAVGGAVLFVRGEEATPPRSMVAATLSAPPPPVSPPPPTIDEAPPIRIEPSDVGTAVPRPAPPSPPPKVTPTKPAAVSASPPAPVASSSSSPARPPPPAPSAKTGGLWDDRK